MKRADNVVTRFCDNTSMLSTVVLLNLLNLLEVEVTMGRL